jgi:hypothetical protein
MIRPPCRNRLCLEERPLTRPHPLTGYPPTGVAASFRLGAREIARKLPCQEMIFTTLIWLGARLVGLELASALAFGDRDKTGVRLTDSFRPGCAVEMEDHKA